MLINKNSLDIKTASKLLPKREPFSHKGSFGRALLICGSKNMVGCCALATEGALRSGAGLVTLAFPECLYTALTSRLIENLFFTNSPLHDGAMIIVGKKIRAAGCILPVSQNPNIPKHLGLRHRAGLGISQETDAKVIIVSEERGRIAYAHQGKLTMNVSPEELQKLLVAD